MRFYISQVVQDFLHQQLMRQVPFRAGQLPKFSTENGLTWSGGFYIFLNKLHPENWGRWTLIWLPLRELTYLTWGKKRIIFTSALWWDMLISKRVICLKRVGSTTTMGRFHNLRWGKPPQRWVLFHDLKEKGDVFEVKNPWVLFQHIQKELKLSPAKKIKKWWFSNGIPS